MDGVGKIEGRTDLCSQEESQNQEDCFVWDENSQLYYHSRSGFYHDPDAGWYYSTRDGLYFKFEEGNYRLLDSYNEGNQSEIKSHGKYVSSESQLEVTSEPQHGQNDQENEDFVECISSGVPENPPPPSEWLEDTLIELYLSGYSNAASNAADDQLAVETDAIDGSVLSADGSSQLYGQGDEASLDEEIWRAQYGQVVELEDESRPGFPVADIWDWKMVREIQKEGNSQVARIVGRLVQPSSKLHPSMPPRGGRLRTAPICKVHLDLVQVRSGQVYKLRSPNAGYLATLSSYDASNPTKEWGFPELSIEWAKESSESKMALQVFSPQYTSTCSNKPSAYKTHKSQVYRDRAAERRALHGGFGVAPGQKRSGDDASPSSPAGSVPVEEAAAESLEMSLGAGSYAQKILKKMGWKQGEGLGKSQQGMREPLQGIGNKGTAGLGWYSTPNK